MNLMLKRVTSDSFSSQVSSFLLLSLVWGCNAGIGPQGPQKAQVEASLAAEELRVEVTQPPVPQAGLRLSGAAAAWVGQLGVEVRDDCAPVATASPVDQLACGLHHAQGASLSYGAKSKSMFIAAECFHWAMLKLSKAPQVRQDSDRLLLFRNSQSINLQSQEGLLSRAERRYDIVRFEWVRSQVALGKAESALASLEFLSEAYPREPEVWGGLGVALLGLGRLNQSIVPLTMAVKLEPQRASRWDNLGTAQFLAGDVAQAVGSYREALSRDSLSPQIRADLGAALLISGEIDEGIAHLREAVRREPKNGLYLSNLAYALYIRGDLIEARKQVERATLLAPKDVSTWLNLVTILAASSELEAAQKALLEAEKLESTDPRVSKARSDLNQIMQLKQ